MQIDLRAAQDGEIRAKEQIDGEVVSALIADLTGDNQCQLLVVFQTGQGDLIALKNQFTVLFGFNIFKSSRFSSWLCIPTRGIINCRPETTSDS